MNITNKYCLLSELSQAEIDTLICSMPDSDFWDKNKCQTLIGFTTNGAAGLWSRDPTDQIITYKEMLSLLGEEQRVPHVHQKEIIAWANGEEIEFESWIDSKWKDKNFDSWDEDSKFRVKPKLTPTQLRIKELKEEIVKLKAQDDVECGARIVLGS